MTPSDVRTWDRPLTPDEILETKQSCDYCHAKAPTRVRFFNDGVSFLCCSSCSVGGA